MAWCLEYQWQIPGPSVSQTTPPSTIGMSLLTTRPCPICLKRIGTSGMVSHIWHNTGPILDRKDSLLGCLRLEMTYSYMI